MEDLRYIVDETLPSILDHSPTGHTNEILDNITLSSNLGLPVAASTEARQKTDPHDRLCDQASYMERQLSSPLTSSCSGESDSDPRRKLILNLQDTVENCNKTTETCLESDQNESDLQRRQTQNYAGKCLDNLQDIVHERLSHLEDLTSTAFASLEKGSENNKVSSSLEFGQKWITNKTDDTPVTGFSRFIENEKLLSFASLEGHSTDDDIGDEEFCDDQLEAYFEQLVLPEREDTEEHGECIEAIELPPDQEKFQMPAVCPTAARTDAHVASDEESYAIKEIGHNVQDEQFMVQLAAGGEEDKSNNSSNKSHVRIIGNVSEMCTKTAASHICPNIRGYLDQSGEDGISLKSNTVINNKNSNGEPTESQPPCTAAENTGCNRDATNITNSELKLDSVYFKCVANNTTSEIWNKEQQSHFSNLCQEANESSVPLPDVYLSPSAYRESEHYECALQDDSSHNVVYQNEEGKWVTDLAYYTSFDKEQALNCSNISGDFIAGSEAVAMIAQDQEEFEREHKFIQEEKMDSQNTSGLGDSSWKSFNNYNPLKASQADLSKEASYLRLSLGEFFGQRSDALGCLGGGGDVKRPSFGYHITSPVKRQPVPLLRQSDVSRANFDEQNFQMSDSLQGDAGRSIQEETYAASVTFNVGEIGTPMKDNICEKLEERKIHKLEPSVLSISTIASAIANVSVSAEPSQLAALMMKLTNKSGKGANIPEATKLKDFSVISQLISSNAENRTFDMEKYLKRTDEDGDGNESESIIKDGEIAIDWHRLCKQEGEMASSGDLSKSNFSIKHGIGKQHLEKIYEENCFKNLCFDISSEQKKEMKNVEKASNGDECFQSKKLSSITSSKERLSEHIEIPLEGRITTLPTDSELEEMVSKSTLPFSLNSIPVLFSPLPVCCTKEEATYQVTCEETQNDKILKGNDTYNDEKHVTFENTSPNNKKNSGGAVVATKQKLATPVPTVEMSENEQYSFRPSTSPLTHSSPSEASGTSISGFDCPYITPNFKESSCNDSILPKSGYTDPSLQRLTFVSATESTLKNLALSSPERCQSNRASELSTTIVWTSPTSSLEQENGKKDPLKNKIYPSRSTSIINHLKKLEVYESAKPTCLPENQKSSGELPPKSKAESTQNCPNKELNQGDKHATQQDCRTTAHRLSLLKNTPAYIGLDGCISESQNRTNFKSSGVASDIPPASSGIPTLLTGCSLTSTPFAQHYLGSLQSHTNVALPQYHVGCPPVFGVPAGLIYSAIPLDHTQNKLPLGWTLRADMTPGMLGTSSHFNFSSNQNIVNPSKTSQTAGAGGARQWEESVQSGFARVKVPAEVKFPTACCVGLTSHTVLSILNPSERWLQVSISLLSIMLNGEKVEPQKHKCLLFKNKTVIGPCTTEELKMLFLPCQAGVFQCVLSVASWPFSADANTVVQAEALSTRVIVNAVAENPDIEVEAGKTNHLDFGDLPSGSWKALPLKLTNRTCARMPVRLIIHANAIAWRCFTFSKEPVNSSDKTAAHTYNISQLSAPSVISHIMNASCDGKDPEVLVVWVQFNAPSKFISSDSLGPADEYFARIDVELDCPEPGNVLKCIPLIARSGTPRIYAPKGLQTLYMTTEMGLSTRQQLPLKNAGNIKVDLKIMTMHPDSCISVKPENLVLIPEEEQEVTVEFSPKDYRNAESVVKILVLPSGPEYKVTVKGEVSMPERKPLVQTCPSTEVPLILANKQLLTWGGVYLGRTVQQKLILRNDSSSTTQQLRLLIRGQDQDCFQLKLGERVYNNCEIKIRPKHDYSVCLTFTPSQLACMFAKLEMKQLGLPFQPGIKFTIPLYGYGGKNNVKVEDVKKRCNRYIVELYELSPSKTRQASFTIRNTGHRAAYVKGLCFKDFGERNAMEPNVMNIFPDKFVLKEGLQQKVTVIYNSTEECNKSSMLATICVFYGDEISRQQYRRVIQHNAAQVQKILPANNPVINVKFDEEFPGEELVTEVYDLPQHSNDLQCFFTNMRRITLSVVNAFTSKAHDLKPSSVHHVGLERPGISEKNSMTLDVLPVKGPHGCPLSSATHSIDENQLVSQDTWTLQSEFLILTAPSQSGTTVTKYAQITNNSSRWLKFELSWPAHCLTVTPQHGTIEPRSCISIHVSPNPSLAENKSIFPWSGLIYIHCDGGQKTYLTCLAWLWKELR
ncbi:centrosomal protein of 192 kDa isoform X2 [Sceloporus undulatus]|uniref:centrosomal protein of 192 kDa isoform X2 n=1 Tax=Sceloporus undulatus TaxID=8520 RepID=UPI001C4AFBB0|nr:centrosomal protein of 192 kDa isoform X2 [Sceloporus undulatus]